MFIIVIPSLSSFPRKRESLWLLKVEVLETAVPKSSRTIPGTRHEKTTSKVAARIPGQSLSAEVCQAGVE